LIKVVTAEMSITVGGFDLVNIVAEFKDGDVKSAATKIINSDGLDFFLF